MMAEPNELTYDDVIRFLNVKGGRSTNRELVSYFRKLLNDPVNQVTNRLKFRDIVNAVANVREEQGVKYVCLKEKYFNSYSCNQAKEHPESSSTSDLQSSIDNFQVLRNESKPQNYQPYWRYRLSSNTKLVPPPPLLSFRLSVQEETTSLPVQLTGNWERSRSSSFSEESCENRQDSFSSLKEYPNVEQENYYSSLQREDPVQLESSWIHEHGSRYQRFYSEPKDPWTLQSSDGGRPRHNSIAVGRIADSVSEVPNHAEHSDENSVSPQTIQDHRQAPNGNPRRLAERRESSSADRSSSCQSSMSTMDRDVDSDVSVSSRSMSFQENHLWENKENICNFNKNDEKPKQEAEDEENVSYEFRPHSESVKERARRIENMANEMASTTKTPLPVSSSSKLRLTKAEKASDDNASVSSQLDSKLRRQWFVKAAQSDYHGMVALLKKEPRLAGIRDITSGFTALHWAAKHGNAEVVKLIAGTHKVNPDVKSHGGYTCLHIATLYKHKSIVDLLIRTYGANPTIRDNNGKRADQYPPNYVSFTAGMNRRLADTRTSITVPFNNKRIHVRPLEKDPPTGTFIRIGSLNLKVSMTAPGFGGSRGRRIQRLKTWGSADSVNPSKWPQNSEDKAAFLRKKKMKKKNSDSDPPPTVSSNNGKHDSDSDSAYGFHS